MDKIGLPGENWAMLREPEDVPEKLRKPLQALQRKSFVSLGLEFVERLEEQRKNKDDKDKEPTVAENFAAMKAMVDAGTDLLGDQIQDLIVVALVAEWSYDYPISPDGIGELPGSVVDALRKACEPLVAALTGQIADEDVLNPESPTAPANGIGKP